MKRVAIIGDVRGWAFDHIATGIKKYNPDPEIEIDVMFEMELRQDRKKVMSLSEEYDLLYPFSLFQSNFLRRVMLTEPAYITTVHMGPLCSDVPVHPGDMPKAKDYWPDLYKGGMAAKKLSVISDTLDTIWQAVCPDVRRLTVGVDPDLFYPAEWRALDGPLRVGWVGNPEKPFKRFDMVEAACQAPGTELATVAWRRAAGDKLKPHADMAAFYQSIDVLLCMSDHEGLPTPMIEAAACGIPSVSVDVGVVQSFITDYETGFIVDQTVEAARDQLCWLRDNREECARMGTQIIERAEARYWPKVVGEWIEFMKEGMS